MKLCGTQTAFTFKAIPGTKQPFELRVWFCEAQIIWKVLPHQGGFISNDFSPYLVDPPDIILWQIHIHNVLYIFRRNIIYYFKGERPLNAMYVWKY